MNKNILYVCEFYDKAIPVINKKIQKCNYKQSIQKIHSLRISWSDLFEENFKDFNFIYIYPNIVDLQKKWCHENNINFSGKINTVIKQISIIKPQLIFFQSTSTLNSILKKQKLECKYFFWDGTSRNNKLLAKDAKGVMTNMNQSAQFYKKLGLETQQINHFFDERIKFKKLKKKYFITFIGGISNKDHFDRCLFLYRVSKLHKINFFIGDQMNFFRLFGIILYNFIYKKKKIKDLFLYFIACRFIFSNNKRTVFGVEMYKIINQSKIILNYHLNSEDGFNMRLFETTGLGSCILTDYRPQLELYFKLNKEILVYQNIDDAISIIDHLKKNQRKIFSVSKLGKKKIFSKHLFKNRKKIILNFIKKLL